MSTVEVMEIPKPRSRMANAAILPALAVIVLWSVFLLDHAFALDLHRFGIVPRTVEGLRGILFAPLLHADVEHLFNNSLPVFVLGWALLYFYPRVAGRVMMASWLVAGLWVWISARANLHIGASGVVYGLAAFLLVSGVLRRQRTLMALSMLVVFLYGSMIWGVFPLVPRMSWESHLWGAVVGIFMAWLYRGVPPAVQDPQHKFEEDEEEVFASLDEGDAVVPPTLHIVYHVADQHAAGHSDTAAAMPPSSGGEPADPDRTSGTWSP